MPFERLVEAMGLVLQHAGLDDDPGRAELREAAAVHDRVGVAGADHRARDAGCDHRIGARRGGPVVIARLERAVQGSPACAIARLAKRHDLGMRVATGSFVPALAGDRAVGIEEDRTDHRVRRDAAPAVGGELEGPPHLRLVPLHPHPSPGAGTTRRAPPRVRPRNARSSHPDSHGRSRNRTGSTHDWPPRGRGLSPPVGTSTPPRKQASRQV